MGKKSEGSLQKPSYLGLLNAIAVGEARGGQLLEAWSNATPDPKVAEVLKYVAVREYEHAAAFTKRLSELGFNVRQREDKGFAKRLELASSKKSDKKKFKKLLGLGADARRDGFSKVFDDQSIDPQTGALLGRFIAEERDSLRRLNACCTALNSSPPEDEEVLNQLAARLDKLTETLTDLKSMRG